VDEGQVHGEYESVSGVLCNSQPSHVSVDITVAEGGGKERYEWGVV
jgi:hypothetical protein